MRRPTLLMPRRSLGLRARVIAAFAIGALLLSVLLSVVTYSLTRSSLVRDRESAAFLNAAQNAELINDDLTSQTDVSTLVSVMTDVVTPTNTLQGMLHDNRGYYVDALRFTDQDVMDTFRNTLVAGNPAQMTYDIDNQPYYVVGLPLPSAEANAWYMQAAPLTDIEDTLDSLLPILAAASAITTILGMGFGFYVARLVLTPVDSISAAAGDIAQGDLTTRLESGGDPDLAQLAESFNGMTTALQERIERDSRFASDVSHELRSPLMTLTGSVAVLERRRAEMPERAQVALDLLVTDIDRFKQLVEDLLEISRFDVGAVQLEKEEVMVGEFVRQAIGAAVSRQREVPIIHAHDSDAQFALLDKRRIAQVIRNLSENADKYAGGVTQIRLVTEGEDLRIELEDEGPGVPVAEREVIFERFARGGEGGRRGSGSGVGLGLSLVTEHLRLHGGTIHVADRVDGLRGARFVITLPGVIVE